MASTIDGATLAIIESELASLERELAWAVDLACRWDDVAQDEQVDLAAEWPLIEEFYETLRDREREGVLDGYQLQRFERLRESFLRHYPALVHALGDGWITLQPSDLVRPDRR